MADTNTRALDRYRSFFENLNPDNLSQINQLFAPQALFVDPFNEVRGHGKILRIFQHLLKNHPNTRFIVIESQQQERTAYLYWRFLPDKFKQFEITGCSRVIFDQNGLVLEHRDFWDTSSQLYARLPLTGWLFRRLLSLSRA